MRTGTRLRVGRVLALGLGVWFRRFVPIHLVTAVCLAPLLLVPQSRHSVEDGTIPGVFGLYSTAWVLSMEMVLFRAGLARNAIIGYLAQFAVTVILVREAHRRLAGRPAGSRLRAIAGLVPFSVGSLAAFAALDLAAATLFSRNTPLPVIGAVATAILQTYLAATFWLALPAAAVDGHGLFSALGRSLRLTRGSRFPMAVTVLLLIVLESGAVLVAGLAARDEWAVVVPITLFVGLKACILAAAYREICLLKEGLPPDEIGAIFA